jgi:hypothetical protein
LPKTVPFLSNKKIGFFFFKKKIIKNSLKTKNYKFKKKNYIYIYKIVPPKWYSKVNIIVSQDYSLEIIVLKNSTNIFFLTVINV